MMSRVTARRRRQSRSPSATIERSRIRRITQTISDFGGLHRLFERLRAATGVVVANVDGHPFALFRRRGTRGGREAFHEFPHRRRIPAWVDDAKSPRNRCGNPPQRRAPNAPTHANFEVSENSVNRSGVGLVAESRFFVERSRGRTGPRVRGLPSEKGRRAMTESKRT